MARDSSQADDKSPHRQSVSARSVSELAAKMIEPTLARRTGMRLDLLNAWPELVGDDFAASTSPERIDWPRRVGDEDPFRPATLIVACETAAAIFFQHSQDEILQRINGFFGFEAIARFRIVQKPVTTRPPARRSRPAPLAPEAERALRRNLASVEDPKLRETLFRLGSGVRARKR